MSHTANHFSEVPVLFSAERSASCRLIYYSLWFRVQASFPRTKLLIRSSPTSRRMLRRLYSVTKSNGGLGHVVVSLDCVRRCVG